MNSSDIEITTFRQILLLPLTLAGARTGVADFVREYANGLDGQLGWSEVTDHLAHLGPVRDKAAYAEFVYFHGYIQNFLYDQVDVSAPNDGERSLRLFRREHAGRLEVSVNIDGKALGESGNVRVDVALPIVRMRLYLFELGVAILAVEVALEKYPTVRIANSDRPMSLAHALALQNALRRIYPPYFKQEHVDQDSSEHIPEYPASLRWCGGAPATHLKPSEWIECVAVDRRNPIDQIWKNILAPLPIEVTSRDARPRWRQIIDERVPSMVFIGTRDASGVERKDFARLCFLDDPGTGFPCAEAFLEGFERRHCYDRHWCGTYGTRYLFSGYSMVMFGTGDPEKGDDIFHQVLSEHFRRHYFQMGLLIQLQFAALLSLSQRVSEAVKDKRICGQADFRRRMLDIEEEVLTFEQRYWFTQVSNQLQAREIYELWLKMTGVAGIYDEVRGQVRAANAYLDAREQEMQTGASTRLTVIATFGVIIGLAMAFLGMNVLASPDFLAAFGVPKELPQAGQTAPGGLTPLWHLAAAHAAAFFGVLTVSCALGRFLLRHYSNRAAPSDRPEQGSGGITARLNADLATMACAGLFLTIVCMLFSKL